MGDGRIASPPSVKPTEDFTPLINLLREANKELPKAAGREPDKLAAARPSDDVDKWMRSFLLKDREARLGMRGLFPEENAGNTENIAAMQKELKQFQDLIDKRSSLEKLLPDDHVDSLRRLRRDYSNATNSADRLRIRQVIDASFPEIGKCNNDLCQSGDKMLRLDTSVTTRQVNPQAALRRMSTIQCHRPQEDFSVPQTVKSDPFAYERHALATRIETFYQEKPEDKFESVWQKMKDASPVVKVHEVLKHLPPLKLSFERPTDIAKMILIMAGTEPNATETRLLNNAFDGVKSIEKKAGGVLIAERDGVKRIPPPQAVNIGAGISLEAIELGTISLKLGEGKNPSLENIQGITIKLHVPSAVKNVAGVSPDVKLRKLEMEEQGDGGWQLYATVDNPISKFQRRALATFINNVPVEDRIRVPIASLDKNGNAR